MSENLSDIKTEVDKYLSWLTEQKQVMTEELAPGNHVQNAEVRLQNSKVTPAALFLTYQYWNPAIYIHVCYHIPPILLTFYVSC